MAKYTIEIKEILQMQNASVDQIDPDTMYTLASKALFGNEINVISDEYRKYFVTAFAYHYFFEEIGMETFGFWRMALIGKIYENANYMNSIFANDMKQLFSEYTVTSKQSDGKEDGSSNSNATRNYNSETSTTQSADGTNNVSGSNSSIRTDNLKDTTTYGSSTRDTGSSVATDSGSDSRTNEGTTEQAHTGYDSSFSTGYSTTTHSGDDTSESNSKDTNKFNNVSLTSDTPMGSLDNLITAVQSDATGTGVSRATANVQFNYLSGAIEDDRTTVDETESTNKTTYNSQDRVDNNLEGKDVYNSQNTQNDNTSEVTTYGRSTNTTRDLTSSRTGSDTDSHTGTSQVNESGSNETKDHREATGSGTIKGNDTTDTAATTNIVRSNTEEINNYKVTFDLIMRSQSIMRKIWDIFDPLFMQIL